MLSQNTGCGPKVKTGKVGLTGSAVQAFSHNIDTQPLWIPIMFKSTATTYDSVLQIGSTTDGACGPVIEEVSIKLSALPSSTATPSALPTASMYPSPPINRDDLKNFKGAKDFLNGMKKNGPLALAELLSEVMYLSQLC
jgi:hypothetical protein